MARRVKDFVEIGDYTSLDQLINTLTAIRDSLPEDAQAELRMRGDDVFGRRLAISYFRDLTAQEAEREARYSGNGLPAPNAELEDLRKQLDRVEYERDHNVARRRIRRVA
jgi:hypothetical protein